jgi:RNA polymerase sigma factor (sigma-70 family)
VEILTGKCPGGSIEAHLGLIRPIAQGLKRRLPDMIQLSDLESAGREGLAAALRSFDGSRGGLDAWLRFKIRAAMIDSVKGKGYREACHGQLDAAARDASATPEESAMDEQGSRRMRAALDGLTPKQRDVLTLRYSENLSERETAAQSGISVEAVKRRRRRAVKELRAALGSERLSARAIAMALG